MDDTKMRIDIAMRKTGDERESALLRILEGYDLPVDQYAQVTFELGKLYLDKGEYRLAHHSFGQAVERDVARRQSIEQLIEQRAVVEQDVVKRLTLQAELLAYIASETLYDKVVAESFQQQLPQIAEQAWQLFRRYSNQSVEDILFQLNAESYGYQVTLDEQVTISYFRTLSPVDNERTKKRFTRLIRKRDISHIPENAVYFKNIFKCLDVLGYGTTDEEKLIRAELGLKFTIVSDAVSLNKFKKAVAVYRGKSQGNLINVAYYFMMQRHKDFREGIVNANQKFCTDPKNPSYSMQIWADLFDIPVPQLAYKSSEEKMFIALDELKRISDNPDSVLKLGYARMIHDYITKLTQVGQ